MNLYIWIILYTLMIHYKDPGFCFVFLKIIILLLKQAANLHGAAAKKSHSVLVAVVFPPRVNLHVEFALVLIFFFLAASVITGPESQEKITMHGGYTL